MIVESGKTFFSLIFWKHGAVNEFYGAIDISFQMREGGGSGVSRQPRSGKSRSCYTRNLCVNVVEFPYCELCDNDIKQSSYRLVNVLFRSKALFTDFSKSPKYLTTEERTATIFFAYMHLSKREIFHSYEENLRVFHIF